MWDLDPKLLLLGDFAENGTWWTGSQEETRSRRPPTHRNERSFSSVPAITKTPQMNWGDLMGWYSAVVNTAAGWFVVYEEFSRADDFQPPTARELQSFERDLLQGQEHARRVLLKATEMLLKRPGRPLKDPVDLRFLLILLENPLLYEDQQSFGGILQPDTKPPAAKETRSGKTGTPETGLLSGQHSGIIKRIVGLISNSSVECHNQLITWFARHHPSRFTRTKELASGFLTYRMLRQRDKKREVRVDITAGLIPQMQEGRSGAYLYDEINRSGSSKKTKEPEKKIVYSDDWQIKASSRVLALLFAANNLPHGRRSEDAPPITSKNATGSSRDAVHSHGQVLPTSDFYNSMIDYTDLIADFENWEARRGKFSFCQYPFLLSIWAKNHILEHDARRQMQSKARDAFFDSIMSRKAINQFLELNVRRDCLVDDSLKAVSEVIGSGSEDIKKGLRITFKGEEGVDAGGLRKEWFLLLVREVFNPDHGERSCFRRHQIKLTLCQGCLSMTRTLSIAISTPTRSRHQTSSSWLVLSWAWLFTTQPFWTWLSHPLLSGNSSHRLLLRVQEPLPTPGPLCDILSRILLNTDLDWPEDFDNCSSMRVMWRKPLLWILSSRRRNMALLSRSLFVQEVNAFPSQTIIGENMWTFTCGTSSMCP